MKIIFVVFFVHALILSCLAQDDKEKEPEYTIPEFIGEVAYVGEGKYTPLEQKQANVVTKGGPYAKVKVKSVIPGSGARLRIHPIEKVAFLIRVPDNSVNPRSIINVFKLEQDEKKNERFVLVATAGTFSGVQSPIKFLDFNYKKYKENCILISFPLMLDNGEYAITLEGSRQIFNVFAINNQL